MKKDEIDLIFDTKEALRKGGDRVEKLFHGISIDHAYHVWSIVQGLSEFVGSHILTNKQLDSTSLLISLLKKTLPVSSAHNTSLLEVFETLYYAGNVRRSMIAFFEEHGDGEVVLPLKSIIEKNEGKITLDKTFMNVNFQEKFEKDALNRTQIACTSSKNNTIC